MRRCSGCRDPNVVKACPYGQPGDRFWVKETHYKYGKWIKDGYNAKGKQRWRFRALTAECRYADNPPQDVKPSSYRKEAWYRRPSIFMRREYSRVTLEITGVRVERVQDISIRDAIAELGGYAQGVANEQVHFMELWDSINAKRGYPWKSNPWVWVVGFRKLAPSE
jgi:hypothetical protein